MHASLIVPAPFDTLSGGYAYDRRMVAGLRASGHRVDVIELAGRHPLADDAARAGARAAYAEADPASQFIIDGLALPSFAGMGDALEARAAIGLIHHPTALEAGWSESDRAGLRNTELRLLPRLSRIIAVSDATAERLVADFGVDRTRVAVVVPGTVDAPRSTGSSGHGCAILSIGALVPRKGHDVLLRALARLFDLAWRLTIVGTAERDPAYAHMLEALAGELAIADQVHFAGEVDEATLEALWREADLFALASHWEAYGMAIAEALKRGVPVALTAGGAAAAQVPAEAGVIAPPGDHAQLSKSMRRLIFSAELRRSMAEVAWQTGRTLPTWPAQIEAFAKALQT